MNTRRVVAVCFLAMLAFSAVACGATSDDLRDTQWTIESIAGSAPIQGAAPTLSFAAGEIEGTTGCNHYGGSYSASKSDLSFGGVYQTEMACMTPAGIMERERAYLDALRSVAGYRVESGRLELLDDSGALILSFVSADGGI
jgi:heat shock protein HslJ